MQLEQNQILGLVTTIDKLNSELKRLYDIIDAQTIKIADFERDLISIETNNKQLTKNGIFSPINIQQMARVNRYNAGNIPTVTQVADLNSAVSTLKTTTAQQGDAIVVLKQNDTIIEKALSDEVLEDALVEKIIKQAITKTDTVVGTILTNVDKLKEVAALQEKAISVNADGIAAAKTQLEKVDFDQRTQNTRLDEHDESLDNAEYNFKQQRLIGVLAAQA